MVMTEDRVERAKTLIAEGHLRTVRTKLGLSVTMQSHMIGVQPQALRSWESGDSVPRDTSCLKVLNWYEQAMDKLTEINLGSVDLVHVSLASQILARSYATVAAMCESGALQCVDLGSLGLYVAREELEKPGGGVA